MTYLPNVNADENIFVRNGNFDDDSVWTEQADWSIGGGVASYVSSGAGFNHITQTLPEMLEANVYQVTFTISNAVFTAAQGLAVLIGGNFDFGPFFTNGVHVAQRVAGAGSKIFGFRNLVSAGGQSCDIDNVSIVPLGTKFKLDYGIDHRPIRGAVQYDLASGDRIYHALSWSDRTNCIIKYTP